MFIPMWVIFLILFLIKPDFAFLVGFIYICYKYPLIAIILALIFALAFLIGGSCALWDEKVRPFLEENKTINKIKPYLKKFPDFLYYFFLFIIFGFSLFMILYGMIY